MNGHRFAPVEDYTAPFLVMSYVVGLMCLVLAWGMLGYGAALALCLGADIAIRRLGRRLARREAAWDARVARAIRRRRG